MNHRLALLGLLVIFLCIPTLVVAHPDSPHVRLPTDLVTMNAVYGDDSYFDLTLSDVPPGFDVTNGIYPGWCVQKTILMTRHVNHSVLLYSSYDLLLPSHYQNDPWAKINYILNHKQGTRDSIQNAIWYYTDAEDCSADPDASAMIAAAEAFGAEFIPTPGQALAIPVEGVPSIQLTFIELRIPQPHTIEGLVWHDSNRNGLQDNGEPGIDHIRIELHCNTSGNSQTTTDSHGYYSFNEVPPGSYQLLVTAPKGYFFSPEDVGTNDRIDSDVNMSGTTPWFTIPINITSIRWDAGLYSTPIQPSRPRNHRPTADGTAGEPYQGFINTPILFNGSRSYDRDGRIISWEWTFGDGTSSFGEIVSHVYSSVGDYPVTLTVKDNWYASDVYTTIAHVMQGNHPPQKPLVSGPLTGHANTTYHYIINSIDQDNDPVRYDITWGDGEQDTYQLYASGYELSLGHIWTHYGFYSLNVIALDPFGAASVPNILNIAIDVHYVADLGYLIDTNSDGIFDLFHSNNTGLETKARFLGNGDYLLDTDGDGNFDTVYNILNNEYRGYFSIPYIEYLSILILLLIIIVIYLFLRMKRQTRILSSTRRHSK